MSDYIKLPKDMNEVWFWNDKNQLTIFSLVLDIFMDADSDTNLFITSLNSYSNKWKTTPDTLGKMLRTIQDWGFVELYEKHSPVRGPRVIVMALRHNKLIDFDGEETHLDLKPFSFTNDRAYPAYRRWHEDCLKRDKYTCQKCGATDNLCVHHIKPYSKYPRYATELSNGITLCKECHKKEHRRQSNGE